MLDESVQSHISGLTDEDLLEYIRAGTEMYRPDAIEYAHRELEHRGLSQEQIVVLLNDRLRDNERIASLPLGWPWRIVLLIVGIPGLLLLLLLWRRFREDGEHRKFRDTLLFGLTGTVIQLIIYFGGPLPIKLILCLLIIGVCVVMYRRYSRPRNDAPKGGTIASDTEGASKMLEDVQTKQTDPIKASPAAIVVQSATVEKPPILELQVHESSDASESAIEKIEKLWKLKERGLISEEEFQAKKVKLLDSY
jgi:membrane protein implicated in regulation of membrane protease activity